MSKQGGCVIKARKRERAESEIDETYHHERNC